MHTMHMRTHTTHYAPSPAQSPARCTRPSWAGRPPQAAPGPCAHVRRGVVSKPHRVRREGARRVCGLLLLGTWQHTKCLRHQSPAAPGGPTRPAQACVCVPCGPYDDLIRIPYLIWISDMVHTIRCSTQGRASLTAAVSRACPTPRWMRTGRGSRWAGAACGAQGAGRG